MNGMMYIMPFPILLRSLVIGFTVAAAVGPIFLLCVQRTLARGWAFGLVSGLGVATADGLYGFIAALGLAVVSEFLVGQQTLLRIAGGLFLCFLGLKIFFTPPQGQAAPAKGGGYLTAYASIFLLTLANPLTLLSFAAIFAGICGVDTGDNYASAGLFGLGIFLGSASLWLIVSAVVSLLREQVSQRVLGGFNRVVGVVIAGFGFTLLISLA